MKLGKTPFTLPLMSVAEAKAYLGLHTPTPANTSYGYGPQGFAEKVRDEVAKLDGWELIGYGLIEPYLYNFNFKCHHGNHVDHSVSTDLLVAATSWDEVVAMLIREAEKRCWNECPVYSFGQGVTAFGAAVKEFEGITESFVMEPMNPETLKECQEQIAKAYGFPLHAIIPDPAHKPGHYSYTIEAIDENGVAKEVGGGGYPKATLSWADATGLPPYKFTPPKFEMSGLHITDLTPLDELAELVPALKTVAVGHPKTPEDCCTEPVGREQKIGYMIVHLNDRHEWSREQIADWLDSLENVDLVLQPAQKGD